MNVEITLCASWVNSRPVFYSIDIDQYVQSRSGTENRARLILEHIYHGYKTDFATSIIVLNSKLAANFDLFGYFRIKDYIS